MTHLSLLLCSDLSLYHSSSSFISCKLHQPNNDVKMNKKQAIKQRQAKLEQEIHAADILKGNLVDAEQQTHRTTQAQRPNSSLEEQIIARHETRIESLSLLLKDGYQIVGVREAQIKDLKNALEERDKNFEKFVVEQKQGTDTFMKERDAIYDRERRNIDAIHKECVDKICANHDEERRNTDALHEGFVDRICGLHGERVKELVGNIVRLEERIKELEGARSGGTDSAEDETGQARTVLVGEEGGAKGRSAVASEEGKILELIEKGKQETEAKRRGISEEMSAGRGEKNSVPVEKAKQETVGKRRGRSGDVPEGRCVVS